MYVCLAGNAIEEARPDATAMIMSEVTEQSHTASSIGMRTTDLLLLGMEDAFLPKEVVDPKTHCLVPPMLVFSAFNWR